MPIPPATAEDSSQQEDVRGYFAPLAPAKQVLLSMLTRHGAPASAPVRVVLDGDRAYFRTWKRSRIRKHLRHADWVQVAPCGVLGLCRYGPWLDAAPRLLDGEEAGEAARMLARKRPARPGRLGSPGYRLRGRQPVYYELQAGDAAVTVAGEAARPSPRPVTPDVELAPNGR